MEIIRKPHLHQDWIDSHAYGIVKALQKAGFESYLVGGCVRDLLLNIHPKDFDIATMATPPQVKKLIYMAFIIGKRFRLVLVKRDNQQFEVATFRREVKAEDFPEGDAPTGDNVFGTPEEDARRRDFTINALFYDPVKEQILDYVNGLPDIEARVLRMIGEPDVRLVEDPIRILRGLRFAHKVGFAVEPTLRASMMKNAVSLQKSVLPRRREEILKILRLNEPELCLLECFDLGILEHVIPTLHDMLSNDERRELFLEHFAAYRSLVDDPSDTTQLFGWLVYSMLQAALLGPTMRTEPITIEDEVFQAMMRDELGMYRFEQTVLTKAVELAPMVSRTEDFKRRGERRQISFMKNEGFKLALRIAVTDMLLTAPQLAFWSSALERLGDEIEDGEDDGRPAKRRRRPRRRRGGPDDGRGPESPDAGPVEDRQEP
ncbi:MAG: poly(A) polymerase [Bdellovibrionota bacterium]